MIFKIYLFIYIIYATNSDKIISKYYFKKHQVISNTYTYIT